MEEEKRAPSDGPKKRGKRSRSCDETNTEIFSPTRRKTAAESNPLELEGDDRILVAEPTPVPWEDPARKAVEFEFHLGWFLAYVADLCSVFKSTVAKVAAFDRAQAFRLLRASQGDFGAETPEELLRRVCVAVKFPCCGAYEEGAVATKIEPDARAFYNLCEVSLHVIAKETREESRERATLKKEKQGEKISRAHTLLVCSAVGAAPGKGFSEIACPPGWCLEGSGCVVFAQEGFVENFKANMTLHHMKNLTSSLDRLQLNPTNSDEPSGPSEADPSRQEPREPVLSCFESRAESETTEAFELLISRHDVRVDFPKESVIDCVYLDPHLLLPAAVLGDFLEEEKLEGFLFSEDSVLTLTGPSIERMLQLHRDPSCGSWARLKPRIRCRSDAIDLRRFTLPWILGLFDVVFRPPSQIEDASGWHGKKAANRRAQDEESMRGEGAIQIAEAEAFLSRFGIVKCLLQREVRHRTSFQAEYFFEVDSKGKEDISRERAEVWSNSLGISFLRVKYCK